jgi:hypothetical protein
MAICEYGYQSYICTSMIRVGCKPSRTSAGINFPSLITSAPCTLDLDVKPETILTIPKLVAKWQLGGTILQQHSELSSAECNVLHECTSMLVQRQIFVPNCLSNYNSLPMDPITEIKGKSMCTAQQGHFVLRVVCEEEMVL